MRNVQQILARFSLAQLKKLSALLPISRNKYNDALTLAALNRDKIEKLLPPDFSWAELYELETKQMFILYLCVLGLLDRLIQAYHAGLDINQYLLDESIRASENEETEDDWTGGHGGAYTEADFLGTAHAAQNSMRCQGIYGHYLNDLVKLVREGGKGADDAFFNAVSIDRTVLTCPTFAARLARAEYFREKIFMLRLRKAVKGKPHDSLLTHQDLRNMMQLFLEMKTPTTLTLDEADYLLIKELKLYQDAGQDPARSLMRFIQRWKAEKSPAT